MRIINIRNNLATILICCLVIGIPAGCAKESGLDKARGFARQSQEYYQHSLAKYKELISRGKDLDRLHLELGKLYYGHGDFKEAADEFKKTGNINATKFLALSYYRLGNFTDALEIFNKQQIEDGEYLFFKGLTCEKLNLFDQALESYRKIKDNKFVGEAVKRIDSIEKRASLANIKELDPQIYKILANAPAAQHYPQAGALILLLRDRIEVSSEGKQVTDMHYLFKILNERGKENFSEAHINYDSTYEKVELEYARTIKPDGTVVDVGSRHIRDVSRYLNFPIYSNARVFIISFPEVSEGAVIEYKAKIYNNELINKKDFVVNYAVQSIDPVISADFMVSLPKNRTLHIKNINEKYNNFSAVLEPAKEEKADKATYRWQFRNIPQIVFESNMPAADAEINPSMLISTFDNWQSIYEWWWKLARDKIKADRAIQDKVAQLIRDKKGAEEKIRAIYNFCAKEIRYVAIEYGQAGFEPHRAEDTFRNKYGDCKDKAILLITMLKEAGFRAWPVLIPTREHYALNEDLPSNSFNHAIAALPLEGKIVFMDTTAETCSFGDLPEDDQERKVLIIKEDGYEIEDTPLYPAEHNLVRQALYIKINRDETIQAEKSIFSFGSYDQGQRYWLLYTQPELIQETLKERIQDVSIGAKLDKYNIENLNNLNLPVVLKYSFRGPEYFTAAGRLRIMPQLAAIDTTLVAKDKRRYPIDFGGLETRETVIEIEFPKNFTLKFMPENVIEESPWLKFSAEYSLKDKKIYFRQKFQINKRKVTEDEYPAFKDFFERLAKRIKQRIVLEKAKDE